MKASAENSENQKPGRFILRKGKLKIAFAQGETEDIMASINITPLTDVLFVLLVIFMITAAAIQKERIKIPTTHYKAKAANTDLIISVQQNRKIFVGAIEVPGSELEAYLETLVKQSPLDIQGKHLDKVIVKADEAVPYGVVAQTMDSAKSAGLTDISLATKPLDESEPSAHPIEKQGG